MRVRSPKPRLDPGLRAAGWRQRIGLGATIAALGLLALAAPAGAIVAHTPGPDISYQPLTTASPRAALAPAVRSGAASQSASTSGLDYHGGPVMHSSNEYAIFWTPSGFSFPSGYESAITTYLQDVAADSGKATNVYSVGAQYTDTTGRALYQVGYKQSLVDTDPYPTRGNCLLYQSFVRCLTNQQISSEVDAFIAAHSLPRGLTNQYFVFLPSNVGTCLTNIGGPSGTNPCSNDQFCAYHSFDNTGGTTLYAVIPDLASDPVACGTQEYPNGHANGNADDVLSGTSHEANEMITDPRLDAWYSDADGEENGDLCLANESGGFGSPLGGTSGALFNQIIGPRTYYLQREWSNAIGGCEQRYGLNAAFNAPAGAFPNQTVSFDGTPSNDSDGGAITSYEWSLGDGATASGPSTSRAYSVPGTYNVSLTITNTTGLEATVNHQLTVGPPRTLKVSAAGAGTVSGPGIACPGDCTETLPEGLAVTLTAAPAHGARFMGWSGACTGKGACTVRISGKTTVSARFSAKGTNAPKAKITKAKVKTAKRRAKFVFTARGTTTGFECRLSSGQRAGRFRKCDSPQKYRHLKAGRYTFSVRAVGLHGKNSRPAKTRFVIG